MLAHPFIKGFDQVSHCLTTPERELVARGDIPLAVSQRTEADLPSDGTGMTLWTTTFFIGLQIDRSLGVLSHAFRPPSTPSHSRLTRGIVDTGPNAK